MDGRERGAAPEHQLPELEGAEKPLFRSSDHALPHEHVTHVHSVLSVLEVFC